MRHRAATTVVGLLAVIALAACSTPEPSTPPTASPAPTSDSTPTAPATTPAPAPRCTVEEPERLSAQDRQCLRTAALAGADYLATRLTSRDPTTLDDQEFAALAVLDHLHRRWGIEPLARSRTVAGTDPRATSRDNPSVRLWSTDVMPTGLATATDDPLLRLERAFLACESRPLGRQAVDDFDWALTDGGGYAAAHALWWPSWADELGCSLPARIDRTRAAERVEADMAELDRLVAAGSPLVNDLSIEQGLFLTISGHGDRVRPGWAAEVVAAQLPDGSWFSQLPHASQDENWHPTYMAVWYLLALADPDAPDPGFLP